MAKRAIIYARVSTDEQRGNYSVRTQIEECEKYINRCGYMLVGDKYIDPETGLDSASGTFAYVDDISSSLTSRPGLDAAYDYLQSNGFDVVVIYSIDRLARDPDILRRLKYGFLRSNATVEYVTMPITNDTLGEWQESNIAFVARLENEWRTERFNRGKIKKAKNNYYVTGNAPFGYKLDKLANGGLKIIDDESATIKKIFDLYINENKSINEIVNYLNENKIKSKRNSRWGRSSITKILSNTSYIGKIYYNKSKSVITFDENGNKNEKKDRRIRDKSEWIEIQIDPIIDNDTFEAAKKRLEENKNFLRRKTKRFYMLTGLIFCENCGKSYVSQTTIPKSYNRYSGEKQSYRHRLSRGHCRNHNISAEQVEKIVWEKIENILLDPDQLLKGYKLVREKSSKKNENNLVLQKKLQKEKERLEISLENLTQAYIDPEIGLGKSEYLDQRNSVLDKIKKIQLQLYKIEASLPEFPTLKEFQNFENFSKEIKGRLTSPEWAPTPENKRKIIELLQAKVLIDFEGKIQISGRYWRI